MMFMPYKNAIYIGGDITCHHHYYNKQMENLVVTYLCTCPFYPRPKIQSTPTVKVQNVGWISVKIPGVWFTLGSPSCS